MEKEEQYLITLCNAYLKKQAIKLDESVDYSRLFSVCREHNLLAIAFCPIKNSQNKSIIPQNIYKNFEDAFYETIIRYDMQSKVMQSIDKILSDNDIKHIFFKGAQIRDLYPVPETRAMSDIDILIEQDNRDKVKKLLLSNSFEIKNSNGPVYDYTKDGILIEMHTKIISGKVGSSNAENCFLDAIEHAQFTNCQGTLDADYHLAYLITHIAHHFWFYGAGIKMILDLAVFQSSYKIDYDKLMIRMEQIGLLDFSKTILSVCYKWFGVGQTYNKDVTKTEEFLTSFGAFGNAKRNKAVVVERKELEEGKKTSPIMTRLRLLFPPYSKLKNIPYIKFIEGRPYLVPFAWIYRIFYNFKYKRKFVMEATLAIGSDETDAESKKELSYFEEIGLI
jgi:predicted nucleotidyltransferase